jgi:hypothetical protein
MLPQDTHLFSSMGVKSLTPVEQRVYEETSKAAEFCPLSLDQAVMVLVIGRLFPNHIKHLPKANLSEADPEEKEPADKAPPK